MLSACLLRDTSYFNYIQQSSATGGGNIVQTNLVLNLNSIVGSSWKDFSGLNNNFTLYNSPTVSGNLITFNGTNQYSINTSNFSTTITNFTISMWVKPSSITSTCYLFSMNRSPSNSAYEGILQVVASGRLNYWDYSIGSYGYPDGTYLSTNAITSGVWSYVSFVKNGTSGTYYINGISNGIATASQNVTYGLTYFSIAGDTRDSVRYFPGQIGQVLMYSSALTSTQILQNYNATKSSYGL